MENDETSSSKNEDKFLPKCPYCGETLPSRKLQNHMIHCRLVLEKCPRNCGIYITRQQKESHLSSQCSKMKTQRRKVCSCHTNYNSDVIKELETTLKIIQHKVEDEKRNRLQFEYNWLNEVAKLHERCQKSDDWQNRILEIISSLQESMLQEEQWRLNGEIELKEAVGNLSSHIKNIDLNINELKAQIKESRVNCSTQTEYIIEHFDNWRHKQEHKLASLNHLNSEFEKLQVDSITRSRSMLNLVDLNEVVIENQEKCLEQVKTCEEDIDTFKEFLSKENIMISGLWYEQRDKLHKLDEDFRKNEKTIHNLILWKSSINKRIETFENLIQNQFSSDVMKKIESPTVVYQDDLPMYSNGHLLWCIVDFEYHLSESKERNVILQSPIFYSHEYGYRLQMKLHPNGLGQWKGRHMIISLHVVNSEWDALLQWPFKMNTTVTMKDQSSSSEQVNDLVKSFGTSEVTKYNETSRQLQMFIPHRALRENVYIKNDTLILEAKVRIFHDLIT